MEFKIFVVDDDIVSGQKSFDASAFISRLAELNIKASGISLAKLCQIDGNLFSCKDSLLLLCKNADIDKIIIDNISSLPQQKEIVDEQAVIFKEGERQIIFLPFDIDFWPLLQKIVGQKNCKIFRLFGKSPSAVREVIAAHEELASSIVVARQGLCCDIYLLSENAGTIDERQVLISSLFKDNIYSENSLSLAENIIKLLELKNKRLAVDESVTGGLVCAELSLAKPEQQYFIGGKVGKISEKLSSDEVYDYLVTLLRAKNVDIACAIDGKFYDGTLTIVFAIGDLKSIDVYKNAFKGDRQEAILMAKNSILFHLLKKLRQNDLNFD